MLVNGIIGRVFECGKQYTASCELHIRDCCTNMYRAIVPV